MSSTNSPALTIELQSQRSQRRLALLVLAAGAASPWLVAAFSPGLAVVASIGCAGALAAGLRRCGWLGGDSRLVSLIWLADGRWLLRNAGNETVEGKLHTCSRVGTRHLWLRWRLSQSPERSRSLLLAGVDVSPVQWRRLRVRLLVEGMAPGAAAGGATP